MIRTPEFDKEICNGYLSKHQKPQKNFSRKVLFIHGASFTGRVVANLNNKNVYVDKSWQPGRITHYQQVFKFNMWTATTDNLL